MSAFSDRYNFEKFFIKICSIFTISVALIVLIGWANDIEVFKSILPNYITMKVNTAICFILASIGLLISLKREKNSSIVYLLCTFIVIICSFTLAEYFFDKNFGIDELLTPDLAGIGGRFPPGRLAPITAVNFILIALSLAMNQFRGRSQIVMAQIFSAVVFFSSFQALVGYVMGTTYVFGSTYYTQMALHTGLGFVALSCGSLFLHSNLGIMRSFTANTPTAKVNRWMILATAFIPAFIRCLALIGFKKGFYDDDFSQLFQISGITFVMIVTVSAIGIAIFRAEEMNLKSQASLTASEKKFQALANFIPQMAWMTNADGFILWYNQRWFDYTGSSLEEMIGDGWKTVHHPDHLQRVSEKFAKNILSGMPWEDEFPLKSATGEWRWFLSRAMPIVNEEGKIETWFGTNTDVTEQKESREALVRALKAKDDIMSVCSHELRTPITSMKLSMDLYLKAVEKKDNNYTSPERVVKMITQSNRQLSRLNLLIDTILDFNRVNSGKMQIHPTRCDISAILEETIEHMSYQFAEVKMKLICNVEKNIIGHWDKLRLEQVFINLLSNALKFGSGQPVCVKLYSLDGIVFYSVQDQGIGIDPKDFARIFSPYERAVTIHNISGFGLGLFISKEVVEAHGGQILVKSRLGIGTEFCVTLPLGNF